MRGLTGGRQGSPPHPDPLPQRERENFRRGWCPGALRPMPTGDGLLVRLRVTGGLLQPAQARGIATLAGIYGNGMLDLSSRANLHLRGVSAETLAPLQDGIAALGLLDDDPAAEAVRNVVSSPLTGIDPAALVDVAPLGRALERHLIGEKPLHLLPGKFGFAIDDGGLVSLRDITADIGFEAVAEDRFGVSLAGMPAALCASDRLVDVADALAKAFLALRGTETRMRDLGIETVLRTAGLKYSPPVRRERAVFRLGFANGALGIGARFGRMTAGGLELLAVIAAERRGELRLSPFRAIFLTRIEAEELPVLRAKLGHAGFVLDDNDPSRRIAACIGAPSCRSATTDVLGDAARFAGYESFLHVSGCSKGCAYQGSAPVTLVGRDGRYDLVLNGSVRDTAQFRALDAMQVETVLADLNRSTA